MAENRMYYLTSSVEESGNDKLGLLHPYCRSGAKQEHDRSETQAIETHDTICARRRPSLPSSQFTTLDREVRALLPTSPMARPALEWATTTPGGSGTDLPMWR